MDMNDKNFLAGQVMMVGFTGVDEISEESMKMAERVVDPFSTLPIEEAYLLSVHFEVAKDNNQ